MMRPTLFFCLSSFAQALVVSIWYSLAISVPFVFSGIMPGSHRSRSHYNDRRSRHDSRDRKARHSGGSRQYQGRSRSRYERRRSLHDTSLSRGGQEHRPVPFEVSSKWKPSESHFDTTQEYGLNFPRVVEATKWTRQQQLANRPVEDIRAFEVCSGGSTNWSLRLIANGRYVSFEAFRSKVDAILWTYVSREIYKHPQLDLNQIIGIKDEGTHQDWETKLDTIKKFGDEIATFVESKAPKDPNQQMLEQMEKLKEENARLKQQVSQSTPSNQSPVLPASSRGTTTSKGPMDAFVKPGEVDKAKVVLDQYRRKPTQPALLSSNSPKDGTPTKIRDWIQNNLAKSDQDNIQAMTQTIQEELDAVGPDEQPAIDKILVDWGLSPAKVNKMKADQQIKLLAAMQFLKH